MTTAACSPRDASHMIDMAMCETTDTGLDVTGASETTEPEAEKSLGDIRRRHQRRTAVAVLAAVLAGSAAQGCCDPTVAMDTSSTGESSTTSDGGASESTGASGLPGWALGVFSSHADKVGTTIDNPLWYGWGNIEITESGAMVLNQYACSTQQRRQEFRWTLADDRQSLSVEPVPPAELFEFGSDSFISEIIVEPGDSCDTIAIRYFNMDVMQWFEAEYRRGEVCATAADPDICNFTFEWCDGEPPPPCE